MRAAAETFICYIATCFRSLVLHLLSLIRVWPTIAANGPQSKILQGEEERLLENECDGGNERAGSPAPSSGYAGLDGEGVTQHQIDGNLEGTCLEAAAHQTRSDESGAAVTPLDTSADVAKDCCAEKVVDVLEEPGSLSVHVPEQEGTLLDTDDDVPKEVPSRTSSCFSPRGPLDIKSLAVSDSETDLSVQQFEGEPPGGVPPDLLAEELERLLPSLEPAFEWKGAKFLFPNPRDQLGSGANGDVERILWLGPDSTVLEPFAVKIMTPPEPAPGFGFQRRLGRWQRVVRSEVDILDRVRGCPHVVQYSDALTSADGTVFIIMGLVDGRGLNDWIAADDRSMRWSAKKDILRQLAQAVASCHRVGVFHGDIKPSNVMASCSVSATGLEDVEATLLDFGAGCFFRSSNGLLPHGEGLYGSVAFMSPEQLQACQYRRQGMPRGPLRGPPVDCWAVGLVAFELFTGISLFSTRRQDMPDDLLDDLEGSRVWYEERLAKEHDAWYTLADSPIRQRFASAAESLASSGEATDDEIKEFQDFVMRLLKRSPLDRLTALGMLGHSFLT